jgi:hypothetical protein
MRYLQGMAQSLFLGFECLTICFKQNVVPKPFEILDGSMPCSTEKMALFLERVLAYPQFVFTIVNTEQLNNNTTELLILFLSDRDVSVKGVNLYVVQRGDLIHASPWVSGRSWEMEKEDSTFDGRNSWLSRMAASSINLTLSQARQAAPGKQE